MHAAVHQTDKQTLTLVVTSFARPLARSPEILGKNMRCKCGIYCRVVSARPVAPAPLGICEGGGEVTEMHQISGKGEENEEDGLIT